MNKIVAACLLLLGLASPALAEDKALGLQPPAPVACADAKSCDRDPAHLRDFAVKFFEWYVDNEINGEAQPGEPAARLKFIRDSHKPFETLLTDRFRAKLAKLEREMDASPGDLPKPDPTLSSLCGGADADNIICAQDYDPGWRTAATAAVSSVKPKLAVLAVTLPWPANSKEKPHRLGVTLIPEHGDWRIDRIAAGPDR